MLLLSLFLNKKFQRVALRLALVLVLCYCAAWVYRLPHRPAWESALFGVRNVAALAFIAKKFKDERKIASITA